MQCASCGLEINQSLCQVCSYLVQEPADEAAACCESCGAPLANFSIWQRLCHVCSVLDKTVRRNEWLHNAHCEWERENILYAKLKKELLGQGGQSVL